ncbi:MAG: 2-phosphosulfolactate phosphatase [Bacteroidia bacterium]|nr:MAG: 2-phosphosulfolactate phosphatase [Bacteroidia bacterium]
MIEKKREIEVILSIPFWPYRSIKKDAIVVVIDILRASTSMVGALDYGLSRIRPMALREEARKLKTTECLLAAEIEGKQWEHADMGNSVDDFRQAHLKDKELILSTTNGTRALHMAAEIADTVVVGAFANLNAVADYIRQQDKDVILFCSGYKNTLALEDQLFAGALANLLMRTQQYHSLCDALKASIDLWRIAQPNLLEYIKDISHRRRLPHILSQEALTYTFTPNSSECVPVFKDPYIQLAISN